MSEAHEECGIAAVSMKNGNALYYLYRLILNMQNRGQLSAGVTTYNPNRIQLIDTYRDVGTVNEVFRTSNIHKCRYIFRRYRGIKGIAHVRYATSGSTEKSYAQPFERHHGRRWKWFSFCFNGNLANYLELKRKLLSKGYHIIHNTDTEIMMHYISRELRGDKKPPLTKVFANLSKEFDGAYNIAFINSYGDIAVVRDPLGIRPLSYTIQNGNLFAASESNALFNCGIYNTKSLEPGKMIVIENGNIDIKRYAKSKRRAHCMFEWVYFANVGSILDGKSVYVARTRLGKELAKLETETITSEHIVVPVPDTAKPAGDALAYELGVPAVEGLIRNRYVGRTFIENINREDKVENKYIVIKEILKDKKVILVDDSIVRGTTSKKIVRYLKRVGRAKEVHLRISCPPIRAPCFYGIDMSTVSELLVPKYDTSLNALTLEEETCEKIAHELGADSLIYQTIPGLVSSIGLSKKELCMACLNGNYPTPWGRRMYCKALEEFKQRKQLSKRTYE